MAFFKKGIDQQKFGYRPMRDNNFNIKSNVYQYLTRGFAETRTAFITRWFWLAEIITLGFLVLFGLIDFLLFLNGHFIAGIFMIVPVAVAFGLWRLANYLRKTLYRQITKALYVFDQRIGQGAARLGEWPDFFKMWRRSRTKLY